MPKKINASYRFCVCCGAKATMIDGMGSPWCDAHKQRHDLINWGKEHGWPEVNCQASEETVDIEKSRYRYYAVGAEYSLWFTACAVGSEHFIQTLSATVFGTEQGEV